MIGIIIEKSKWDKGGEWSVPKAYRRPTNVKEEIPSPVDPLAAPVRMIFVLYLRKTLLYGNKIY